MIPKILFQTSPEKPEESLVDQLKGFLGKDWVYIHFNDSEIVEFFKSHPVAGLENIVEKFHSMPKGPHKADLFRYYFLYLKGGFFLDSDAMLNASAESLIKNYSFVSVNSYKHPGTIFQGLLAASPEHKIIHEALLDAYTVNTEKLARNYRLLIKNFHDITKKHADGSVMLYQECFHDENTYSILNDRGAVLALHYWRFKKIPARFIPKKVDSRYRNLIYVSLHGKDEYIDLFNLLFCSLLFNSPAPWDFTFLVQTSKKFLGKLDYLRCLSQDIQILPTEDKPEIFDAALARYDIFDFSRINEYETILYLDMDILIGGDLNEIFRNEISSNQIYCLPEGLVSNPFNYYGKALFEEQGRQDLLSATGFTSGAILFKNTNEIKTLFEQTRQHTRDERSKGRKFSCLDQPFLNYHALSKEMAELVLMKRFMKNNPEEIEHGILIYHFPGGPGFYASKHKKMAAFIVKVFQEGCEPESWSKAVNIWEKPFDPHNDRSTTFRISEKLYFVANQKFSAFVVNDVNSQSGMIIDTSTFKPALRKIKYFNSNSNSNSKAAAASRPTVFPTTTTPVSSALLKNRMATTADSPGLVTDQTPEAFIKVVEQQRKRLSDLVFHHHNNTVANGPFKGLHLVEDSHWASADRGVMTLGLYEQEVLQVINERSPGRKTFINLGAGDGYYCIGVLINKHFEKSYCFEISPKGREVIQKNAQINNVTDRILIHGEATKTFYTEILEADRDNSMLLVDIEGREFSIIDENTFKAFSNAIIIIEIHEWYPDIKQKLQALENAASKTHSIKKVTTSSRDPSQFPELRMLSDANRWLLCAEGRPYLMSWLIFDPKPGLHAAGFE